MVDRPSRNDPSSSIRHRSPAAVGVLSFRGDDEALFLRLQAREPSAPAALYDRFHKDVNRQVRRVLGPDRDHDDLVQTIFIRLIRSAHKVREASGLRAWVISVSINTVYSELRKRAVRRAVFGRDAGKEELLERGHTAPADISARSLLKKVYEILEQMPVAERLAFTLRYIEERSLLEVAELLDVSLATCKRRISKAQKRFVSLAAHVPELHSRITEQVEEDSE